MYKPLFNQRKALRFRHFSRKGYALFACLGRVVTIGVLSVATLQSASAASDDFSSTVETTDNGTQTVDKEATLDDVEITGSRAPLALGQAARMVTVLSREDIQAAPVQSINDLLKYAVGVDVRQRGPIGAQTDIGIRGGTSEQIAVLLNGINICDPQTGHNVFDLPCDLSDIVRIEVLEGPAGRVYGTSSLMGAVNIVTRSATPQSLSTEEKQSPRVGIRLEGGSFGYLSTAARIAFSSFKDGQGSSSTTRGGREAISFSFTRSDGYQRAKSGALNSNYEGGKVFYQGECSADNVQFHWHAGLSAKGFGSNTFYSAKYDEQYEKTTKLFTSLQGDVRCKTYEVRGHGYEFHLRPAIYWNRSYDRFELIRGDDSKVPFNYHRTDVFGINLNAYFDWLLGRTAMGAEFRNEDIVSTNLGEALNAPFSHYKTGLNRSNLSLHLEHNILLSRFTLSAGFIAVKNTWNEMPFTLYPGIDVSYRIGRDWKIYASYNSSLRMPSFTELYYSVGGHKADKYLKPEELRAVEGGIKFSNSWLTGQASIYHHHARNMIDWVMDTRLTDPVWQSVNHTKVNTFGEEVSITSRLTVVNLQLSYCHQHQSKDETEHLQSQYSLEYLRHKLTACLQLTFTERLHLTVGYRWQDRMGSYTNIDGVVENYRPYSILDGRLTWNTDNYSIYLEGNNLTNNHYVDYGNVPQPGTWLTVGFKCNLAL